MYPNRSGVLRDKRTSCCHYAYDSMTWLLHINSEIHNILYSDIVLWLWKCELTMILGDLIKKSEI